MEANSGLSWDNWMEQQHRKKDFQGHCLLWKHFYMSPEGWASSDVLPASVRHGIDERYPMGRCAFPYFLDPQSHAFDEAHRYVFYWVAAQTTELAS